MQPKDTTTNEAYKGFTNYDCPFYPCHSVKRDFNCLFCYCPLVAYECPGPYRVLDYNNVIRKDCMDCTLPHDGYHASWNFIQLWLKRPIIWTGHEQVKGLTTGIQLNSVDKRLGQEYFTEDT